MKKLTAILCGLSIICTMTGCTDKAKESEKTPVVPVVTQTMYKTDGSAGWSRLCRTFRL